MSDYGKFEIPHHLSITPGNGGLPKLLIDTEWSTAEIYLHGAHVTGFQKKGEPPLLFISAESEFLHGAPIRGGIPVIFPWFGPRDGFPAHGIARVSEWALRQTELLAGGSVKIDLHLPGVEFYQVEAVITVGESLSFELQVKNTSVEAQSFESCLHTYFHIGDIHEVAVSGLQNTTYLDKVGATTALETAPAIHISGEVDRVYQDTTAAVEIHDAAHHRVILVEKSGSHSTVVWNPWIDKSKRMPDFGDDEYLQMVCVESGNVAKNKVTLQPSDSATSKVVISSSPE